MENSLLKTTFHFSGIFAGVEGKQAKFLSFPAPGLCLLASGGTPAIFLKS
jgi:hypothetical protein